jgi:RNA polymerase sigma factor (sigma-70 family)
MDAYRGESKWSYLEKVTRRLAYNANRDRHAAKRNGIPVSTDEILDLEDKGTPAPDVGVLSSDNVDRIRRAIEQLPRNERESMLLQLSGESYEAMAPTLGITVSALKSRLHSARKRLRAMLGDDDEEMSATNEH